jgi:hypothetical protein
MAPSLSGAFFILERSDECDDRVYLPNTGRDVPVAIVRGNVMLKGLPHVR